MNKNKLSRLMAFWFWVLVFVFTLVLAMGLSQKAHGQERSNTFYVAQFAGADVGTKIFNAQASCSTNVGIPCIIVIDAILEVWPQGTVPARCAQCTWIDYRVAGSVLTQTSMNSFATGAGSSLSPWVSPSGTAGCQEAVNAVGANPNGGTVFIPDGIFSFTTTTGCVVPDNVTLQSVGRSAIWKAGANNVVFLSTLNPSGHSFFSRFRDLTFDGNGFTGVQGTDFTNVRFGSVLENLSFNNMAGGIFMHSLDWSTSCVNCIFRAVTAPVKIQGSSSTFYLSDIQVDNENFVPTVACTDGVLVTNTSGNTIGVVLQGGFIQGCTNGLTDSGFATSVFGTYFESNTNDINCSGGSDGYYSHTKHFAGVGVVAIKARNCTGVKIEWPVMGSGGRSTGLFDFDATNDNSYECHVVDSGSKNTPIGSTIGLFSMPCNVFSKTLTVAADFTLAGNTNLQTITGLSFSTPGSFKNYSFHCELAYSQATAAVADAFGIQAQTAAPLNIFASGKVWTSATANTINVLPTLATTTATNIVTFTPSAIATNFVAELDGTIENSNNVNTFNFMASQSAAADLVTIRRGSYCRIF